MNKDIARKWVAALRSDKYKQAVGALSRDGGFCCLGVLCDISDLGDWKKGSYFPLNGENGNDSVLPVPVLQWAQMRAPNGYFGMDPVDELTLKSHAQNTLTNLNDTGKTFEEIADVIEAEVDRL